MVVGREGKLDSMEKSWAMSGFRCVVLYGTHRCGKTELMAEFIREKKGIFFTAQKVNSFMNLRLFEKAVSDVTLEEERFDRWKDAFARVGKLAKGERFFLCLDNFSDLVFGERSILKDFQSAMETEWRNTSLFVVAGCDRVFFTENEILSANLSASIHRPQAIKMDELDYLDASRILPDTISAEDKIRYYGCLGGIPQFLRLVDDSLSFEKNIRRLFLSKDGPLFEAPPTLFLDELREPEFYNSILYALAKGCKRINEIVAETGESSTKVNKYLMTLLQMQIVCRDIPFGEDSKASRKGIYTIATKALAFWFRFVLPNQTSIACGNEVLPNLVDEVDSYLFGKIFEQVCSQYMSRKNRQGTFPILASAIAGYWGSLKESSSALLVATNQRNRQILFANYHWGYEAPLEETQALLRQNDKLFPEYWERYDMLFSFYPFPDEYHRAEGAKLRLVEAKDFYR